MEPKAWPPYPRDTRQLRSSKGRRSAPGPRFIGSSRMSRLSLSRQPPGTVTLRSPRRPEGS